MINEFLKFVGQKNPFQEKYLRHSMEGISDAEKVKLEELMIFYKRTYTVEEMADAFLYWVNALMEEQKYFMKHLSYRNNKLEEIAYLYEDSSYMKNYVVGLGLSTYLWNLHRDMMEFFIKHISACNLRGKYLEIGPGHGEYFVRAIENANFNEYIAVDISETSVEMTKEFARYKLGDEVNNYQVLKKDFFDYKSEEKFDAIVMGEVLEHVENPSMFLEKIHDLASDDAFIYVTTAINAPQPDHIYLFRNVEEVIELCEKAKLDVANHIAVTVPNMTVEKAIKKNRIVTVALILKKQS